MQHGQGRNKITVSRYGKRCCHDCARTDFYRFAKDFPVGEKRIEAMATDVVKSVEDDDDYVIITNTGQKISPKEIFMRSKVLIDSAGKTVDRDKVWKELSQFYKALNDSGVLEQ